MWRSDVNVNESSTQRSNRLSVPAAASKTWTMMMTFQWEDQVWLLCWLCLERQGQMKRHCGDFHSVELENVKESEMQVKEESSQDLNQLDRMAGAVLGVAWFLWLL